MGHLGKPTVGYIKAIDVVIYQLFILTICNNGIGVVVWLRKFYYVSE